MIRASVAAAQVYAFALPLFDGPVPAPLEEPLQHFHSEINLVARYCWSSLPSLDLARERMFPSLSISRSFETGTRAGND